MKMKRICLLLILTCFMAPLSFAQDDEHAVELGVFFDYMRFNDADQNFFGLGARFGINPHPNVGLEAEMAYDFRRNVEGTTETFNSGFRILPALFGLKVHSNGPIRLFGTFKGGFVNFSISDPDAVLSGFTGAITNLDDGDTRGAIYPGGGIELGGGFLGLRLEVGDLIYFADGARHNLKVTVGPQFRF
jgi:hypothetical protein